MTRHRQSFRIHCASFATGPLLFPPLVNSDFEGSINLTSAEAKVEFKSMQPWYPGVDPFGSKLRRQILVRLA